MTLSNNFNLRSLNTWQVGGFCAKLLVPSTIKEAAKEYLCAKNDKKDIYVLGGGSNVLIVEGLLDATVFHTSSLSNIAVNDDNFEKKN